MHVPLLEADIVYLGGENPEYRKMLSCTDKNGMPPLFIPLFLAFFTLPLLSLFFFSYF